MYYFDLYQIPISLKIDKALLTKKYYQLSKEFHPDHAATGNEYEQVNALEMSAHINKAKQVLSDEDKRLEYILKEQKIVEDDEKYKLSPLFLANMMELNEALMELEFDNDLIKLADIKLKLQEYQLEIKKEVLHLFELEELNTSAKDFEQLKEYYYKKKYLQRIMERLV